MNTVCKISLPRSPSSIITLTDKNAMREQIRIALGMEISRRSVSRIVKNDLGMKSLKRKNVHFMTPQIRQKRTVRSKGLLERHGVNGAGNILFSDEKLFTIEEALNSQNDRIIASSVSAITEEVRCVGRIQKPLSVMVWAGVSAIGRTPLVFVPPGVKINSISYQKLILEPEVKDLSEMMFSGESFLFQQVK